LWDNISSFVYQPGYPGTELSVEFMGEYWGDVRIIKTNLAGTIRWFLVIISAVPIGVWSTIAVDSVVHMESVSLS
jgi:hypothetical protein